MKDQARPYRRVRLLAGWVGVQTVCILSVMGFIFGDVLVLALIGVCVGAATATTTYLAWVLDQDGFIARGWRW